MNQLFQNLNRINLEKTGLKVKNGESIEKSNSGAVCVDWVLLNQPLNYGLA
jgi:hypothetical protein